MEDWQFEFDWLQTRHYVKDQLAVKELPDLNGILFMIGIQELGRWQKSYTKEEKQDLMHIAVCRLLSIKGIFTFTGRDQDGWPHFEQKRKIPREGVDAQEQLLKELVVLYFKDLQTEHKEVLQLLHGNAEEEE